jgi:hypothetical protein
MTGIDDAGRHQERVIKKAVSCTPCTITGHHSQLDFGSAFYSEDPGLKCQLETGHRV